MGLLNEKCTQCGKDVRKGKANYSRHPMGDAELTLYSRTDRISTCKKCGKMVCADCVWDGHYC